MTFIENVNVYIRSSIWELDGEQRREGSAEISDVKHEAQLFSGKGGVTVKFNERVEGSLIRSEILFSQGKIEVKKSGAIESAMVFVSGEDYESLYSIPPYSFDMKIFTKALKCSVTEGGGEATVLYRMEIGGAAKSCSMKITVERLSGGKK